MKLWANHPNGVVIEPLIELPDDAIPGETVFRPEFAKNMTDVTAMTIRPDIGWAFSVNADGVPTFTAPTAPAAPPSTRRDFLGFLALFSAAEQAAVVNSTDPRIRLFCLMAAGASYVDLADPRVVSGTQLLENLGLIGLGRADQVLSGQSALSA